MTKPGNRERSKLHAKRGPREAGRENSHSDSMVPREGEGRFHINESHKKPKSL